MRELSCLDVLARGGLGDVGASGHAMREPDIAAYGGAAPHGDAPQHGGAGVDNDLVFQNRMARLALEGPAIGVHRKTFGAQGNGLVQAHARTDDGRLTDHDTGAVVYEKTRTNACAGVDVDAGFGMGQFGHNARQQRHARCIQAVRHAVVIMARMPG